MDIRLMSDHRCGLPLWGHSGDGLPAQLIEDLYAWQSVFEEHCEVTGWDDPVHEATYATQGRMLLDRVRESWPGRTVELDLWPLDPRYVPRPRHRTNGRFASLVSSATACLGRFGDRVMQKVRR